MQNFSPLALIMSEEKEDNRQRYSKNAKILKNPIERDRQNLYY